MIINFQEHTPEAKAKKAQQELREEFESFDVDRIFIGAMIKATGNTLIQGIDYTLQKEQLFDELERYAEFNKKFLSIEEVTVIGSDQTEQND